MSRILKITIDCGDTTCASAPGEFCKYLGSAKFGTSPVCMLFLDPDPAVHNVCGRKHLTAVGGWLQRCQECLDMEAKDA